MKKENDTTGNGVSDDANGATLEGAPAVDDLEVSGDPGEKSLTEDDFKSRDEIFNQVAAKRKTELEEEGVDTEVFADDTIPAEKAGAIEPEPGKEPDLAVEPGAEPAAAKPEPEPGQQPELITIKVDGEEKQVSQEELVRNFQKEQAGARRLTEAAQREKQLNEREALLNQREQSVVAAPPATPAPTFDMTKAQELSDALLTEDTEKVAEIMNSLTPGQDSFAVSPEAVRKAAIEAVRTEQYNKDLKDAQAKFATEFKELDSNERVREMVNQECLRVHKEDSSRTPWEIISKAAANVKEDLSAFGGGEAPPAPPAEPAGSVTAKKRAAAGSVATNRAASRAPMGSKQPAPPATRKSVVQEMIESRKM
jgi:hypothetical protein